MKIETPEAFSARASSLLTKAIDVCGGKDNLPLLNSYLSEAKAKRMTWVEGLEYAIRRRNYGLDGGRTRL